jgi:serine/threonine-protein kinase
MEYVDGESLGEMLQRTGALAAPRAAEIVRQAADALAAAHEMGIVHRDLMPVNIMLMLTRNRDGSDRVKVVDFGLAKVPQGENQNVTSTGIIVGTPAYMSPEQVTGDVLDGRSDIYALALVAYNLLTGALPFTGETTRDMLVSRLTDPPRTLAEARPDIAWPKALQDVFTRALAVRPSNRYQKVGDFADDFVAATATMPGSRTTVAPSVVAALAASRATDAASARVQASWWHRRRVIVIAGVVTIALCVAAGIWGALALRDRPVPARVAPRATIVRPAPIRAPRPGVRR